jgi:hypothetical protein
MQTPAVLIALAIVALGAVAIVVTFEPIFAALFAGLAF